MAISSDRLQRKPVQPPKKTYSSIPLRSSARRDKSPSDEQISSDDKKNSEDELLPENNQNTSFKKSLDDNQLFDDNLSSYVLQQEKPNDTLSLDDILSSDDSLTIINKSNTKNISSDDEISSDCQDTDITTFTSNNGKEQAKLLSSSSSNVFVSSDVIISPDDILLTDGSIPKILQKITFHGFSLREVRIINFIFAVCYPALFTPKKIPLSEFFLIPGVDKSVFYKTINPLIDSGVITKVEVQVKEGTRQEPNLYSLNQRFFAQLSAS
jgi:hypothetical protein